MTEIAVLGYGGRGRIYSLILRFLQRKKARLVAVIDKNPDKLALAAKDNPRLSEKGLFSDYDEFLKGEKRADWLFICTQDADHYRHTLAALEKGTTCSWKSPFRRILPNVPRLPKSRGSWAEKSPFVTFCAIRNSTTRSKK